MSRRQLPWPCQNVVPGMAPVAAILARTEDTVVAVTGIRAYPAGFGFTLNLRLRNLDPRERRAFWPFPESGHRRGRALPGDDVLQLTVEFADGRGVTNLAPPAGSSEEPDPDRPMLSDGPGTGMVAGGSFRDHWIWNMEYRVRPLPPPGPVAFVCTWPGRGIATSRLEVDGAAIRDAADDATRLWLDDPFCSD